MKRIIIPIMLIGLLSFSVIAQEYPSSFALEVEKWEKELVLNGEVGNPCQNDWRKWQEEYPHAYFGLQEVLSMESDFNSDGDQDGLFYFPAGNCVAGNGFGSDFAMLVYSHNGQYLTNKNITRTIEESVKESLVYRDIYDVSYVVIHYTGLEKTLIGHFSAWTIDDARCCPGASGLFEYNPLTFTISINEDER